MQREGSGKELARDVEQGVERLLFYLKFHSFRCTAVAEIDMDKLLGGEPRR